MRIEHAKQIKTQSRPSFKAETKPEEKAESQDNTGKILLTLGALGAIGGGTYMIMRGRGKSDAKLQEVLQPKNIKADAAKELFQEMRKKVVPEVRDCLKFIEAKDTKKLLALGKTFLIDKYNKEKTAPKLPKLLLIKGENTFINEIIVRQLNHSLSTSCSEITPKIKPQDTLNEFHEIIKQEPRYNLLPNIQVLHEADTLFENLKTAAPKEYENEVDKLVTLISEAPEKHKTTIVFSVKDENALPEKLKALTNKDLTLNAKPYESSIPSLKPRNWHQLASIAKQFKDNVPPYGLENLQLFAHEFDRNRALEKYVTSSIMIQNPEKSTTSGIFETLAELTQTEIKKMPEMYLSHDKILEGLEKMQNFAEKSFKENGERRLTYIGDLADIFEPARKALGDEEFDKFNENFRTALLSSSNSGLTVVYSVADPARLPNRGLLNISQENIYCFGATWQNWGKHKPQTHEQINAASEKAADFVSKTKDLKDLGRKFKHFYETRMNDSQSGRIPNGIGIFGTDQTKINQILDSLPEITNSKLVKLDNINDFELAEQEAKTHMEKTGQMTLIYVGDYDKIAAKHEVDLKQLDGRPTDGEYFMSDITNTAFQSDNKPYRVIISKNDEKDIHPKLEWRIESRVRAKDAPQATA